MENLDRTMQYNMCPYNCNMKPNMQMNMENKAEQMMMPPYMYGKCMYNMPQMTDANYMYLNMCKCRGGYNTYMPYANNMEPIENMCGKHYKIMMTYVSKEMNKIVVENMGMMPNSISKDKFNKHVNSMMCEVIKQEKEIKMLVVQKRDDETEEDRAVCPYCSGYLKSMLEIIFVMELLRNNCTFCY